MEPLIETFETLSAEYGRKTDSGVPTTTEIEDITKICKELHKANSIELLKPLLFHNNPYTVLIAASSLLKIFPKEALQKLEDLRDHEPSLAGFEAKWLLREWTDGNYKVPYER